MKKTLEQTTKLNNGNEIPLFGLGTFKTKEETTYESVKNAISIGYKLIDTARQYKNEQQVGKAIKDSKVERKDIFVVSKINFDEHGFEKTVSCVDDSLKNLQLDYIDLMLIHWPGQNDDDFSKDETNPKMRKETYQALEKCQKDGKLKNIGVSNYSINHLKELLEFAEIKPTINQIEFSPFLNQIEDFGFCKKNGIQIMAYAPLGNGQLLENDMVLEIAQKLKKTTAQVLLKWSLQQGLIVIPKTTKLERMKENANLDDWKIDEEELKNMENLNFGARMFWDPNGVL